MASYPPPSFAPGPAPASSFGLPSSAIPPRFPQLPTPLASSLHTPPRPLTSSSPSAATRPPKTVSLSTADPVFIPPPPSTSTPISSTSVKTKSVAVEVELETPEATTTAMSAELNLLRCRIASYRQIVKQLVRQTDGMAEILGMPTPSVDVGTEDLNASEAKFNEDPFYSQVETIAERIYALREGSYEVLQQHSRDMHFVHQEVRTIHSWVFERSGSSSMSAADVTVLCSKLSVLLAAVGSLANQYALPPPTKGTPLFDARSLSETVCDIQAAERARCGHQMDSLIATVQRVVDTFDVYSTTLTSPPPATAAVTSRLSPQQGRTLDQQHQQLLGSDSVETLTTAAGTLPIFEQPTEHPQQPQPRLSRAFGNTSSPQMPLTAHPVPHQQQQLLSSNIDIDVEPFNIAGKGVLFDSPRQSPIPHSPPTAQVHGVPSPSGKTCSVNSVSSAMQQPTSNEHHLLVRKDEAEEFLQWLTATMTQVDQQMPRNENAQRPQETDSASISDSDNCTVVQRCKTCVQELVSRLRSCAQVANDCTFEVARTRKRTVQCKRALVEITTKVLSHCTELKRLGLAPENILDASPVNPSAMLDIVTPQLQSLMLSLHTQQSPSSPSSCKQRDAPLPETVATPPRATSPNTATKSPLAIPVAGNELTTKNAEHHQSQDQLRNQLWTLTQQFRERLQCRQIALGCPESKMDASAEMLLVSLGVLHDCIVRHLDDHNLHGRVQQQLQNPSDQAPSFIELARLRRMNGLYATFVSTVSSLLRSNLTNIGVHLAEGTDGANHTDPSDNDAVVMAVMQKSIHALTNTLREAEAMRVEMDGQKLMNERVVQWIEGFANGPKHHHDSSATIGLFPSPARKMLLYPSAEGFSPPPKAVDVYLLPLADSCARLHTRLSAVYQQNTRLVSEHRAVVEALQRFADQANAVFPLPASLIYRYGSAAEAPSPIEDSLDMEWVQGLLRVAAERLQKRSTTRSVSPASRSGGAAGISRAPKPRASDLASWVARLSATLESVRVLAISSMTSTIGTTPPKPTGSVESADAKTMESLVCELEVAIGVAYQKNREAIRERNDSKQRIRDLMERTKSLQKRVGDYDSIVENLLAQDWALGATADGGGGHLDASHLPSKSPAKPHLVGSRPREDSPPPPGSTMLSLKPNKFNGPTSLRRAIHLLLARIAENSTTDSVAIQMQKAFWCLRDAVLDAGQAIGFVPLTPVQDFGLKSAEQMLQTEIQQLSVAMEVLDRLVHRIHLSNEQIEAKTAAEKSAAGQASKPPERSFSNVRGLLEAVDDFLMTLMGDSAGGETLKKDDPTSVDSFLSGLPHRIRHALAYVRALRDNLTVHEQFSTDVCLKLKLSELPKIDPKKTLICSCDTDSVDRKPIGIANLRFALQQVLDKLDLLVKASR